MKDTRLWYARGLAFQCTMCGHCCSGYPGYVYLSARDLDSIPEFLGMDKPLFMRRYTRVVQVYGERRLSLVEKPPCDCVFWNGSCAVYPVRPYQCRSFPFWKGILASRADWERAAISCPGIGRGPLHPPGEIQAWLHWEPCYDLRGFR
ncbi:MAG: YkgJ family cysteine cluster protein [Spirochaetota bacterium]